MIIGKKLSVNKHLNSPFRQTSGRLGFAIAFVMLTVGCRPMQLMSVEASGPPEYRLGWEDGCDSGVSAEDGGILYKMTLGFKRRAEMADNDQYKRGWNEGFSYCRFSYAAIKGESW